MISAGKISVIEEMIAYVRHLEAAIKAEKAQGTRLSSELESSRGREQALERDLAEGRAKNGRLASATQQLSQKITELEKALSEARLELQKRDEETRSRESSRVQQGQEMAEQARSLGHQVRKVHEINLALRSEIETLKKGANLEREAWGKAEELLRRKEAETAERNRQVERLNQQFDESLTKLIRERDELDGSRSALLTQVTRMQSTIELLEGRLHDMRIRHEKGFEMARVADDRCMALDQQLGRAQKRIRDLEEQLRQAQSRGEALELAVAKSKSDLDRDTENRTFAIQEFERVSRRLREAEGELLDLRSFAQKAVIESENRVQSELSRLRSVNAHLASELTLARAEADRAAMTEGSTGPRKAQFVPSA
jgi:chromosome segregation ATPase